MVKYDKKTLENLILEQNNSYSAIGRIYGVSGNAVKKAAISLGIALPKRRKVNVNENFSHPKRKSLSLVNKPTDDEFKEIISTCSSWKEIGKKLGYLSKVLSNNVKDSILERCSMLGTEPIFPTEKSLLDMTKGELFKKRKNWQSARSCIRKYADLIFREHNPEPKCAICGYCHHIEVAHIKAVSDFSDNATIREIDSIDNLIALCPNHHWEYDNGILQL